jgi:hypothetical protein
VRVKPTVSDGSVIETLGGATLIVAAPEEKPGADAVTLLMPMTLPATTVMFAPMAFSGMVAVAGTVASCELLAERYTTSPPGPAGAGSIIVSVPIALNPKFRGLGVSVIADVVAAVITTVEGLLIERASLTISCTTYVPATSATNVGAELCAAKRVAELPLGRLRNDHE